LNLGRYEIVRELGKGAMGVVYLAKDPLIGRMVALKTLRTSLLDDDGEGEEFRARFLREAQTAGILNHPAIVMIHDVGEDKTTGISFIAMEFVEGKNLKQLIQEGNDFRPDRIADIVAQVAEGLDYAHRKGIVHRDVKPANIILTDDQKAKITDFGIAKIQSSNLTSTGQFLGTPNYMSPEQVSSGTVDGRSDLFSLGVVLYEMLTRKKPFAGENLTQISYKIVHETFTRPKDIRAEIPDGFDGILDRALAKDAAKRYQNGKELAEALRHLFPTARMTTFAESPSSISGVSVLRPAAPPPPPAAAGHQNLAPAADNRAAAETMPSRPIPAIPAPPPLPRPAPPPPPISRPAPPAPVPSEQEKAHGAATISARPKPATGAVPQQTPEGEPPPPPHRATDVLRAEIYAKWFWMIVAAAVLVVVAVLAPLAVKAFRHGTSALDPALVEKTQQKKALVDRAEKLLAEKKLDEAEKVTKEFLYLSPGNPRGQDLMRRIGEVRTKVSVADRARAEADRLLQVGKSLYEAKDYEEAIRAFRESLVQDPGNATANEYLRLCEERLALKSPPDLRQSPGEEITGKVGLNLQFRSAAIGKGFLMVYFGQTQVLRYPLNWSKKTGFLSTEEIGGEFRKQLEVPAGEQQVKVMFVENERKLETSQTINANFPIAKGKKVKTLVIELDATGKRLSVRLV
jgi:serine/threonine-protein kinase